MSLSTEFLNGFCASAERILKLAPICAIRDDMIRRDNPTISFDESDMIEATSYMRAHGLITTVFRLQKDDFLQIILLVARTTDDLEIIIGQICQHASNDGLSVKLIADTIH